MLTDEPSAVGHQLIPALDEVRTLRLNFPASLEVLLPQFVNRFVYEFVDAVFILATKNFKETVNLFINLGVNPRKIISWNADGTIRPLTFFHNGGMQFVCFEGLEFHIRNQQEAAFANQTLGRLNVQRNLYRVPRENYSSILKDMYRANMGRELDLDNPKTYTEKINWLKLNDSTPLKARLSDKYSVREWVENKIGPGHLAPLIGAWDSFDEIDFDKLPDRFVLKCNHGSGMNYFVPDKSQLNLRNARESINYWLTVDYGMTQFELSYSAIKRKILAEEYIDELAEDVILYRVYCFDGEPKFIRVSGEWTPDHHMFHQKFYDCDWRDLGWTFENYLNYEHPVPEPEHFEELKHYAKILCKEFIHARADLYDLKGGILFSEITFFSDAGFIPYKDTWTYERDLEIGNMINLR